MVCAFLFCSLEKCFWSNNLCWSGNEAANRSNPVILKGWQKIQNLSSDLGTSVGVYILEQKLLSWNWFWNVTAFCSLLLYPPAMDSSKLLIVWMLRNMLLYALSFLLWCEEHSRKSSPISWIAVISSICSFSLPHLENEMNSLKPCWKHNLLNCENCLE